MKQQEENKNQNFFKDRDKKIEKNIGCNSNSDCNEELDEIDELLYDYFKQNREVPKSTANVIKNTLYKKKKIKFKFSKVAIFIITISILSTGVVFARNIGDFFRNLFGLNNIGINNDSVVNAIENNYVQNIEMEYTKINDDYSIKIDYIMMDDINLYTVFNICSVNNIEYNYRITIPDLKIIADGKVIFDNALRENTSLNTVSGWNEIKQEAKIVKGNYYF